MKEDLIFAAEKREKKALLKTLRGKLDRIERKGDQEELDWQIQALEVACTALDEYLNG